MGLFAFLWGSELEVGDKLKTPGKKPTTDAVMPTPGEMVTQLQSQVLKRDRFISVFGAQAVDAWGFDWESLENPNISFADSSRISVMSRLHTKLKNASLTRFDEEFSALFSQFLILRTRIEAVHTVRLETITEQYFKEIFPGSNIEYDIKTGGVQLGTKARVMLATGEQRIYHIKTHSDGRLSDKSSAAKRFNPNELLVYKILEYTGFGCDSHFLQRSVEDVYIATLDASNDGIFNVFAYAAGKSGDGGDEVYGQSLWGNLQNIHSVVKQNNWQNIEASIQEDGIAQSFLTQLSSLDVLARILRLHDLLNNSENFGFVNKEGSFPALKVIDFRIIEKEFVLDHGDFRSFLGGNGVYRYTEAHRTMRYALHDRPQEHRVKTAYDILTQASLSGLHEVINHAYQEVSRYIATTEVFAEHASKLMEVLDEYNTAINQNVDLFIQELQAMVSEAV